MAGPGTRMIDADFLSGIIVSNFAALFVIS